MDCSPPDSSVHGILQARILEWLAISFSIVPVKEGLWDLYKGYRYLLCFLSKYAMMYEVNCPKREVFASSCKTADFCGQ